MHVQDDAVGHQSASSRVDIGIEILGCLVCRDEALLIMNCRTRMAAALGSGAAKVHYCCIAPPQSGQISSAWPVNRCVRSR